MTMENRIENILRKHFEEHQKALGRKALSVEARVAQLFDDLDEIELESRVNNVSLEDASVDKDCNVEEVLSKTLIRFLECSLVTDVSPDTRESVEAVQELAVAVAAKRVNVAANVLRNRLVTLTIVLLERVRSAGCRCIGLLVKYLCSENMAKDDLEGLLDTSSQALIPRFTDKAQSVRYAAIEASRFFFHASDGQGHEEMDDPDIRQALQWSLQHDLSVTNRVAALESLPVTLQTIDVILTRVRDVKEKVRVAAINTLRLNIPNVLKWEPEQCAELVESGWTDRCAITKKEVECTVLDWFKAVNFDVVALLKHLNVVDFDDSCQKIMDILLGASDDFLTNHFDQIDVVSFKGGISNVSASLQAANHVLSVERVFFVHSKCLRAEKLEARERDAVLSEILPDIPEICQMFELHASALMKAISEDKDFETTNRLCSICLLLLSMIKSADIEEGSRLHLKATMKGMIESIVTPDDLVEGCIETLQRIARPESEFWETTLSTIESLDKQQEDDGLSENRQLRLLSVLSIVLEKSSSRLGSSPLVNTFADHITSSLLHDNALVREAAVGCLGKIGLFMKEDIIASEYKPVLAKLLLDESEKLAIRAQAFLGLADWSMLFVDTMSPIEIDGSNASVLDIVADFLGHPELSLSCVAAEVACKLLLNGRVCESSWLAHLLILFFDPRVASVEEFEDGDGVKEVGSPVRIQQLLTQFFPLFYLRDQTGRRAFFDCLSTCLEMATSKGSGRKKKGTKTFPLGKMLDFILATVVEADSVLVETAKNDDETGGMLIGSSPFLLAAIQVAKFLSDKNDELSVTHQRTLSKMLGNVELDLSRESVADLKVLADTMEDIGMRIDDETCLGYLFILNDVLDGIDLSTQSNLAEDPVDSSLNDGMNSLRLSDARVAPEKENDVTDEPKAQTNALKTNSTKSRSRRNRLSASSTN